MICQRNLFDLDNDVAYLNGAYMSPLLNSSIDAGNQGLRMKSRPYNISIPDFFDPLVELKSLYAQILNVKCPNNLAITPSVSYGMANAAQNMSIQKGKNEIIVLGEQFPSNYYIWSSLAKKKNLNLRIVNAPAIAKNRGEE